MALRAVEHMFTGNTVAYSAYDSTKTVLGKWIQQKTGSLATDKFAGPFAIAVARPNEQSTAVPGMFPHVIDVGNNVHWVFMADGAATAATRRIICYTYNTATQVWGWRGFLTLTYPTATNHTIRGLKVQRHLYTTGTVAVSGTAVTGTSTAWQTARYAVGARIGFGSTDPNSITTWYYISAIGSDTGITLSGSAGTIGAGSVYVIEELRVYTSTTNATAANGGLFVAKGINFDDFAAAGTTVAAATTTDNIKAVYWLADASTVTNTAAGGLVFSGTAATDTSHIMYVTDGAATSLKIYKYDGRVALAGLASGKSTSAFSLATGSQTVTGTLSQTNAACIATAAHGPGSGASCLYGATTTRIYRVVESAITSASTTFVTDAMVEIPPGGTNTYAATSGITAICYAADIDRFVIPTGANQRLYVTSYQTSSAQFERVFSSNNAQLDQSTADSGLSPYPHTGAQMSLWVEGGIGYFVRISTASTFNQAYAVPLCADWDFAGGTIKQRLITPSLSTTGCLAFKRISVQHMEYYGSAVHGLAPEPFRVYYRTSGISDDSGSWTLISDVGDLSGIGAAGTIQFMFEFRMIGMTGTPARIYGVLCSYEDASTDSHYQPSLKHSSRTSKIFAWRFATAFSGTVPTLTVRLYNGVTGSLLLTDTTATSASGTFEKTTNDGGAWGAYNTTDKANETTYIRYTPASLGDNITVQAILSQG
jgi:hypothetical protein